MCKDQKNRRRDILKRIKENVVVNEETGCWEWLGPTSGPMNKPGGGGGYGRISLGGTTMAVHRVVFTHFFGIIPHKKHIDHKCRNRLCCNPDHLELVTIKQNHRRRRKTSLKKRGE